MTGTGGNQSWSAWPQVRVVGSWEELVETPWGGGVNALCWARTLAGDFAEIVAQVETGGEITGLDAEDLRAMQLSRAGAQARDVLLADLRRLERRDLQPNLDCIPAYPRDEGGGPLVTDVYSWHVDSAPVMADTYLCSYAGAASEGLPNAEAVAGVEVPEVRAALWARYGGEDERGFAAWVRERHYHRHYVARAGARPYGFGRGNLWRIANACPGAAVAPCIHRAPTTRPEDPPRLLLIS